MAEFTIPRDNKSGTKIKVKDKDNRDEDYDPTLIIVTDDTKPGYSASWRTIPPELPKFREPSGSEITINWFMNFEVVPPTGTSAEYTLYINPIPQGPRGVNRRYFIYTTTVKEIYPQPSDRPGKLMFNLTAGDPPTGYYP